MKCKTCKKPTPKCEAVAYHGRHEDCYARTFSDRTVGMFGAGARLRLGLTQRSQQSMDRRTASV